MTWKFARPLRQKSFVSVFCHSRSSKRYRKKLFVEFSGTEADAWSGTLGATKNICAAFCRGEAQISIFSSAQWVRATKRSRYVCVKSLYTKKGHDRLAVHKYFKTLGQKEQCFSHTQALASPLISFRPHSFHANSLARKEVLSKSPMKCKIKFYNRIFDFLRLHKHSADLALLWIWNFQLCASRVFLGASFFE